MSLLRTFERTTSCRSTYQVASQSLFAFLCPALYERQTEKPPRKRVRRSRADEARQLPSTQAMDNCFVTALVRAGSCHNHATSLSRTASLLPSSMNILMRSRREPEDYTGQRRQLHSKPARPVRESASPQAISKEELHSLVDIYGTREDLGDTIGVGPEVLDKPWDDTYFTGNNQYTGYPTSWPGSTEAIEGIKLLLRDPEAPHDELYRLYQKLPGNRFNYLPQYIFVPFLTHLSRVSATRFQKENADKFLSVLYDMRAENIPVSLSLWTTAIRFIGLSEGPRQAVRLWQDMEERYGIKGNNYTFSILFDLAVRTQHFALAEMIENEAQDRRIELDRISRMSRIFYYGLLGDGQGVRRAYAQLVEAGEIVDTAVLTNVITALIDADELPAADETFERMKQLHAEKKGATQAPQNWRQRRELRALLTDAGHRYRDRPEDRQIFQDVAPINPDWRTYRVFIKHHALETGDWDRIEQLLDEMGKAGVQMNKEIYRCLFGGFAKHGGIQLASWNKRNLERMWNDFGKSCHENPADTNIDPKLAVTIVKAFFYCVDPRRARAVWEAMLERWTPDRDSESRVERLLRRQRRSWDGG